MTITITKEGKSLRKITPSKEFEGFKKNGQPIHYEIMKLCRSLEPDCTGYYLS